MEMHPIRSMASIKFERSSERRLTDLSKVNTATFICCKLPVSHEEQAYSIIIDILNHAFASIWKHERAKIEQAILEYIDSLLEAVSDVDPPILTSDFTIDCEPQHFLEDFTIRKEKRSKGISHNTSVRESQHRILSRISTNREKKSQEDKKPYVRQPNNDVLILLPQIQKTEQPQPYFVTVYRQKLLMKTERNKVLGERSGQATKRVGQLCKPTDYTYDYSGKRLAVNLKNAKTKSHFPVDLCISFREEDPGVVTTRMTKPILQKIRNSTVQKFENLEISGQVEKQSQFYRKITKAIVQAEQDRHETEAYARETQFTNNTGDSSKKHRVGMISSGQRVYS